MNRKPKKAFAQFGRRTAAGAAGMGKERQVLLRMRMKKTSEMIGNADGESGIKGREPCAEKCRTGLSATNAPFMPSDERSEREKRNASFERGWIPTSHAERHFNPSAHAISSDQAFRRRARNEDERGGEASAQVLFFS